MLIARRGFIGGALGAALIVPLAKPAIIRTPGLLMRIFAPRKKDNQWTHKSSDEILADINGMLQVAWSNSGYAVVPDRLILSPDVMRRISLDPVLCGFIENSTLYTAAKGKLLQLEIAHTMPTAAMVYSSTHSDMYPETMLAQSLAIEDT
jgi:hypothetical protein